MSQYVFAIVHNCDRKKQAGSGQSKPLGIPIDKLAHPSWLHPGQICSVTKGGSALTDVAADFSTPLTIASADIYQTPSSTAQTYCFASQDILLFL
jgi:hypothetical protein